jgi:hypothetical protein
MGLRETRAEFKAALDTVAGVTGYLEQPSPPRPGDAWPLWGGGDKDQESGLFDDVWSVVVQLLQGSQRAADDWIDTYLESLLSALRPVAYVTGRNPAILGGTDQNPVRGLIITMSRE